MVVNELNNENEIRIFVNKAWAKATGKVKVGKIELEIGKDAFATLEAAAKAVKDADASTTDSTAAKDYEVVVLDSKAVIDDTAKDLFARTGTGKVEITSNVDGKVKGTLEVKQDASKAEIDGFANVTVAADAFVGTVNGTLEKKDYYKVKGQATTEKSESAAAAGKIEIAAEGTLATNGTDITKYGAKEVVGYKTVNVADKATVEKISAAEYSKKYSDKVVYVGTQANGAEADGTSLITDAQVKTTGAVTVNKATVGSINGYKTVTLNDEAKVTGAIEGIKAKYAAEKVANKYNLTDDGKIKEPIADPKWAGEFNVNEDGGYTNVKVSNGIKLDAAKETVSGSSTVTESDVKGGTLKVGKAVVDGQISGFDKVTLADGADVEGVTNAAIDKVTQKFTYKTSGKDEKVYTGKYDVTRTSAISGSFTAVNATIGTPDNPTTTNNEFSGAEIKGFKTVKLTGSNAGAITGSVDSKVTAKYEGKFDALYDQTELVWDYWVFDEIKIGSAPSEKVVELAKFDELTDDEKNAAKAKIFAAIDDTYDNNFSGITAANIEVKDGKVYVKKSTATGTELNDTNYVAPSLDGNGQPAFIRGGIMNWAGGMFGTDPDIEDFGYGTSFQSKTSVTGSVTVAVDKKTPKAVEVGAISNYSKVTLTGAEAKTADAADIMVKTGGISGAATSTYTYKDGVKDNAEKKTITGTSSTVKKTTAAGSLKANYASIGGNVKDFKSVTVADSVISGDVTLAKTTSENDKTVWNVKGDKGGTKKWTKVTTEAMAGSFTATDSVVGSVTMSTDGKKKTDVTGKKIEGYTTVKLTDSDAGNITGYTTDKTTEKTTYTYAAYADAYADYNPFEYEKVTTNKAAGKVTVKATKNADEANEWFKVGAIKDYKAVDIAGIEIKGKKKDDPSTWINIKTGALTGAMNTEEKIKYDVAYKFDTDGNATPTTTLEDGEKWNFKKETAVASAKVTNADVEGAITKFAKVALKNVDVNGAVTTGNIMTTYKKWDAVAGVDDYVLAENVIANVKKETFKSVVGDLSMEDAEIKGVVSGFKTVNVKSGFNKFKSYNGLEHGTATNGTVAKDEKDAIETIKIAKKATLVTENLALQANDKLTVDGELVFTGADATVQKLAGAVSEIKGKGAIFASNADWEKITASFNGDKVKLGYTAKNFKGVEAELADNDQQNAAAFEDGMGGWLGKGLDLAEGFAFGNNEADKGDVIDYIKFEEAGTYEITIAKDATWTPWTSADKAGWDAQKQLVLSNATVTGFDGEVITFTVAAAGTAVSFGFGEGSEQTKQSLSYTIAKA